MRQIILLTASAAAIVGCGALYQSSFDPAPAPDLPEVTGTGYAIDNQHTHVMFKVGHLGISQQYGRFSKVAGEFVLADEPGDSWVWIAMDAASVDTNVPARDQHVRSPDFFDVKEYPEVRFRSTSVEPKAGGVYTLTGDLEFHGVTKEITFDVTKTGEGEFGEYGTRVAFEGSTTLDRFEYGVDGYPDVVGNEIELMLSVEGVKQ